ncbi:MAG: IS21 family transposase [bacterium]
MKRKRRLAMRTVKEIIRLYDLKLSVRQTASSCNVSISTVSFYINRFKSSGIDYAAFTSLTDEEIKALFLPKEPKPLRPLPDMDYIHSELKRKGVTLYLLWEEYIRDNPGGYRYSQFAYRYGEFKKILNPVMRFNHKMGEKAFVDFSGFKPKIKNPVTGEITEVELFVGVLGASNYTFAYAVSDQSLENWINCHIKMFGFFGGVPAAIVPDNLKSGVTKPNYYDPEINPTYLEMSLHYDTVIIPARPYKPKDKPKVENGVLNAQRRILAPLRDKTFFSIEELNLAIAAELKEYNGRPMQKIIKSRTELFKEEKEHLKPLPERYELSFWKRAKVGIDYHVDVNGTHYSVPYQLIHRDVDICYNHELIKIYHNSKIIASHERSFTKSYFVTLPHHMPPSHRGILITPEKIREESLKIGQNAALLIEKIMENRKHPDSSLRMSLGIIRLNKKYPAARVEAACGKALNFSLYRYRNVKNILDKHLENDFIENKLENKIAHENIRGAEYYKGELC